MKLYLIIFFSFFYVIVIAQNTAENEKFFNDLFNNKTEKIIYSENYFEDLIEMKNSIKSHKILYQTSSIEKDNKRVRVDSIVFTSEEINFVVQEFEKNNITESWSKGLVKNSEFINKEVINDIFSDKSKGWIYFRKQYGKRLYSFSKPIFLRNNTICYFYYSNGCGSLCGSGTFAVYVKENGEWKVYEIIDGWFS